MAILTRARRVLSDALREDSTTPVSPVSSTPSSPGTSPTPPPSTSPPPANATAEHLSRMLLQRNQDLEKQRVECEMLRRRVRQLETEFLEPVPGSKVCLAFQQMLCFMSLFVDSLVLQLNASTGTIRAGSSASARRRVSFAGENMADMIGRDGIVSPPNSLFCFIFFPPRSLALLSQSPGKTSPHEAVLQRTVDRLQAELSLVQV